MPQGQVESQSCGAIKPLSADRGIARKARSPSKLANHGSFVRFFLYTIHSDDTLALVIITDGFLLVRSSVQHSRAWFSQGRACPTKHLLAPRTCLARPAVDIRNTPRENRPPKVRMTISYDFRSHSVLFPLCDGERFASITNIKDASLLSLRKQRPSCAMLIRNFNTFGLHTARDESVSDHNPESRLVAVLLRISHSYNHSAQAWECVSSRQGPLLHIAKAKPFGLPHCVKLAHGIDPQVNLPPARRARFSTGERDLPGTGVVSSSPPRGERPRQLLLRQFMEPRAYACWVRRGTNDIPNPE
jgi:hypothetical protein